MDPIDLFKQLKPILEPALDFLEQVAGKTADQAAQRFGAAAWEALTGVWSLVREGVQGRTAGAEALEDLHEDPADPDNRAALMKQVRKVIGNDAEIQSLLAEALATGVLVPVQSVSADRGGRVIQGGPGSVNVGGSHQGDANIYNLTFMEYLAGRALARQYLDPRRGADAVVSTLAHRLAEPDWRETSLLCLAALSKSHGSPEGAAAVVDGLLDREPDAVGQAALLCGLALRDLGPGGVTARGFERTRGVLLERMRARQGVPARTRIECGEVLADLGDLRPEVTTLDGMQFCLVPAGRCFLGSTDEDPDAQDHEKQGAGEHWLGYDYWIARHPVTVAQFTEYLRLAGATPKDPDCLEGCPTAPLVLVTWLEADAFCRWLTKHWLRAGLLPAGWAVRLPSEPEWEKAARGGLEVPRSPMVRGPNDLQRPGDALEENPMPRRRWPWGDAFDADACHSRGHEVYGASPAGCFPVGSSPHGCEDMGGNVWEWTRSTLAEYPYPEQGPALEEREDPESNRPRVRRGGSFGHDPAYVRCACRSHAGPGNRHVFIGFRVVLSPSSLSSEASDLRAL